MLFIILNNPFVLRKIPRIRYNVTSYLQILNGLQYKICTVIAKKKKEDVFGKGGATSGNKICAGIGNTPTETHKFLKQLEKYKNVSRSSVFKWQKRFSDERENVMDDVRDGKPSFRNFGT